LVENVRVTIVKRKKNSGSQIETVKCKTCSATLLDPTNPFFAHTHRHGLCSACLANEVDALKEKLSQGGIINEDVEAQNFVMVKALQYYGDKRNYGILGGTRIRVDKGNRARDALAPLSQEALENVRAGGMLVTLFSKALDEIQDVAERYSDAEEGWSNMDMSEIWAIAEALLMERPKAARCPECDTVHQPLADGILCHACTS